jgi:hypothetical protein
LRAEQMAMKTSTFDVDSRSPNASQGVDANEHVSAHFDHHFLVSPRSDRLPATLPVTLRLPLLLIYLFVCKRDEGR